MNANIVTWENQLAIMEALLSLKTMVSNDALAKLRDRIVITNGVIRNSA